MSVDTEQLSELSKDFTIQVIGVGGAGCNAVKHLSLQDMPGVSFAVVNTDTRALSHSPVETKVVLGARSSRGLGAGGDPDRGRAAAEEDLDQLREICQGADLVFVVAGLGGGTGTGASPVVAQVAKSAGALVLSIVMLPFDCEGTRRQRQAQFGLHKLKEEADGVICLPNQKVFKLIDENTSLLEAFDITNEFVAQAVRGIWRLLSHQGLINVNFADLCSVTQGRHSESALACAEASGPNRAREVTERLLQHPLIEGGQVLAESAGILVCISGGPGLTLTEVNRVMEQVNRHGEQAHIIMGASVSEDLGDRMMLTVVAARQNPQVKNSLAESSEEGTGNDLEFSAHLSEPSMGGRSGARFAAPPPMISVERTEQIYARQGGKGRKGGSRLRQTQLPLEIVSKGRFEKSEPTIHHGQDLDVPTYIRRGVALN